MEKRERTVQTAAPILFPIEPEQFWQMLHVLVGEEVSQLKRLKYAFIQDNLPP
nr:hypothetical protein [uncultured Chitinophaga sp.]